MPAVDDRDCPQSCVCHYDNAQGSYTVSCTELAGYPQILSGLPPSLTEFRLSHVTVKELNLTMFAAFPNLKNVILRHCEIETVTCGSARDILNNLKLEVFDLSHNLLKTVPRDLPPSVKQLLLSHNQLLEITSEDFSSFFAIHELFLDHNLITNIPALTLENRKDTTVYGLRFVKKLALNSNRINSISPHAFTNMKDLLALTLAKNQIVELSASTFEHLISLTHLDLRRNSLTLLPSDIFLQMKTLRYLDLSHNLLSVFPYGLPMLEWLDLSHNRIKTVEEDRKSDVYPTEVWNLAYNPLHCDCHLLWLKELYDSREHVVKHLEIEPKDFIPVCSTPAKLAGKSWDKLENHLFGCDANPSDPEDIQGLNMLNVQNPSEQEEGTNGDIQISIKIGSVTDSTVQVHWLYDGVTVSPNIPIILQYYVFGMRTATTKHVEVAITQREYLLKHLRAETNYILCVTPGRKRQPGGSTMLPSDLTLDDCVEIATKSPPPVQITSYVTVIWYYILGMLATFIAIFTTIGGLALLYGTLNSKGTDWSAKYANTSSNQSFLDGTEADGNTYMTDQPLSARIFKKEHAD